jgi:hypothetical protein
MGGQTCSMSGMIKRYIINLTWAEREALEDRKAGTCLGGEARASEHFAQGGREHPGDGSPGRHPLSPANRAGRRAIVTLGPCPLPAPRMPPKRVLRHCLDAQRLFRHHKTGHVVGESQTTEPTDGAAAVDSGLDGRAD